MGEGRNVNDIVIRLELRLETGGNKFSLLILSGSFRIILPKDRNVRNFTLDDASSTPDGQVIRAEPLDVGIEACSRVNPDLAPNT